MAGVGKRIERNAQLRVGKLIERNIPPRIEVLNWNDNKPPNVEVLNWVDVDKIRAIMSDCETVKFIDLENLKPAFTYINPKAPK